MTLRVRRAGPFLPLLALTACAADEAPQSAGSSQYRDGGSGGVAATGQGGVPASGGVVGTGGSPFAQGGTSTGVGGAAGVGAGGSGASDGGQGAGGVGATSGGGTSAGGVAGTGGSGGFGALGGTGGFGGVGGRGGVGGMAGSGGMGGSGGSVAIGETGRMVGMTAAHNAVRATVSPSDPLPDLTWNTDIAAVAQAYADQLASSGCNPVHSNGIYGENLAWYYNYQATAAEVVDGWAAEVACWPYGAIAWDQATQRDPNCDLACSGCGHYTQIVWRDTTELGCGVASCPGSQEIWVCNYNPQGNYTGQYPY